MSSIKRILVVDDEAFLCRLVALNLEDSGYETHQANSGLQALEMIKSTHFDLVVSDIRMPNGDGIELLIEAKKLSPHLPIFLFMTAYADITDADAYALGAAAIFRKPVNYTQLTDKVSLCLQDPAQRWRIDQVLPQSKFSIELSYDNFEQALQAKLINIGQGGMFVMITDALPQPKETLSFRISFSDGRITTIAGHGVCRWTRDQAGDPNHPRGVGIEFTALTEDTQKALLSLIHALKSPAYIPSA